MKQEKLKKSFSVVKISAFRFAQSLFYAVLLSILLFSLSFAETKFDTVDDTGSWDRGIYMSLQLNNNDYPVVTYTESVTKNLIISVCSDITCSNTSTKTILDTSLGTYGGQSSLILTNSNYPRVSYYDDDAGDLKIAICSNCTSGVTLTTVDSAGDVGGGNSIALNGVNPVISYYDYTNKQVKIAICSNYTCSAAKTITVIETFSGSVEGRTSIALNASGYPIISYFDAVNDDLKLAICNNAACTSKTIKTIDSSGNIGYNSSLKLNSNGYPVVAYPDTTNSALKLAVCHDTACSSLTITTVSNDGSDGLEPSLALDDNNYPIIAYLNDTASSELRLTACKDANCTNKYTMKVVGGVYNRASLALDMNNKPIIAFQDYLDGDVLLATFIKNNPSMFITNPSVIYSGTSQEALIQSSVSGTVSNVLYNGLSTLPVLPGTYTVTADFNPSDFINYNTLKNIVVGDFIIQDAPLTATFSDVPLDYWAWQYIESLYNSGITGGCSTNPLSYCPTSPVTRAQMAVFLLKGIHGSTYTPPAVNGNTSFDDVAVDYWAAAWIKQLAAEGITGGCGNGNYCPDTTVTRDQMAVFLLRAEHGSAYTPPAVNGNTGFTDVPADYWAAAWIKQLAAEAITGGCGSGVYCPANAVTRDQMAVFLQKTFNLPLP